MKELVKGGFADNLSIMDIVNKHSDVLDKLGFVTRKEKIDKIKRELSIGLDVEMEHTDDKDLANEIALDHLYESPIYYTELKKMEKKTEKMLNESKRFRELLGLTESENKKRLMSEEFIDRDDVLNKLPIIEEGFKKENFDILEFDGDDFQEAEYDNKLYSLNESIVLEIEDDEEEDEESYEISDDDEFESYSNRILREPMVAEAIAEAGLTYVRDNEPRELVFDVMEAIYVYTHDFNDNTNEINTLKSLLRKYDFKPSPLLNDVDDLSDYGKLLYDAFISTIEDNGTKDDYFRAVYGSKDDEIKPGPTR